MSSEIDSHKRRRGNRGNSVRVASSEIMERSLLLEIGNTYTYLNDDEAVCDRSGQFLKVHKWALYVKIVEGNEQLIKQVEFRLHPSFSPQSYFKTSPPYQTIQTSYASFQAEIIVHFYRQQPVVLTHELNFSCQPPSFLHRVDGGAIGTMEDVVVPDLTFGVELELTVNDSNMTVDDVAAALRYNGINAHNDGYTHRVSEYWKVVPDSSIQCSRGSRSCLAFEMVSPILHGRRGLDEVSVLLGVLNTLPLSVNKSVGFHVHVGAQSLTLRDLKCVCANFVKFEEAFDLMVPPSRQGNTNQYARSNRLAFDRRSNRQINELIWSRRALNGLLSVMNPNRNRYYKLNLQRLKADSPTLEFRQQAGTTNFEKVRAWVLLVLHFVDACRRMKWCDNFKEMQWTPRYQFDRMFQWVVKEPIIKQYYLRRLRELHGDAAGSGGELWWKCSCDRAFQFSTQLAQHVNATSHAAPSCCKECADH